MGIGPGLEESVVILAMTDKLSRRFAPGSDNSLKTNHVDQSPESSDGTVAHIGKFSDTLCNAWDRGGERHEYESVDSGTLGNVDWGSRL